MSYRIEPNDNLDSVLDYTTHLNRLIFDAVERQAGNTTTTSRPNNTNTTTTTTIATTIKTTITTRRPNITATTSVINFTTTSLAPILTTTPSTNGNCQRDELAWIKLVLLMAILVCLIILVLTVCVTVCYYISSMPNMPRTADIEQQRTSASSSPGGQLMSITPQQQQPPPTPPPIPSPTPTSTPRSPLQSTPTPMGSASSGKIEPKSGRMDAPDTAANISITATSPTTSNAFANYSSSTNTSPYGLKRLSATPERPRRPLASSSNNSTFSIHMAPPSPRSLSIGPGMDAPEETVVKKMALDRIEQEEAKRHQDLALLAEKSSSLAKLGEQLKAEAATAKAATKDAATAAAKAGGGGSVQTPSMPYKSTASKSNKQLKPHESSSGKLVKPVSKEKKKKKKSKEKLGKPKDSSKEKPGKPKDTSKEKLGKSKDSSKETKAKSRESAGKVIGPGLIGSRSPSKPLESIKSATSKQPSFTIDPKTNKLVLEPNVEDDRFSAR